MIDENVLSELVLTIDELKREVVEIKREPAKKMVYTNEDLREMLGVNDKLIRKYRTEGLLSFTKIGDKFWYTWKDVEELLMNPAYRFTRFDAA